MKRKQCRANRRSKGQTVLGTCDDVEGRPLSLRVSVDGRVVGTRAGKIFVLAIIEVVERRKWTGDTQTLHLLPHRDQFGKLIFDNRVSNFILTAVVIVDRID